MAFCFEFSFETGKPEGWPLSAALRLASVRMSL